MTFLESPLLRSLEQFAGDLKDAQKDSSIVLCPFATALVGVRSTVRDVRCERHSTFNTHHLLACLHEAAGSDDVLAFRREAEKLRHRPNVLVHPFARFPARKIPALGQTKRSQTKAQTLLDFSDISAPSNDGFVNAPVVKSRVVNPTSNAILVKTKKPATASSSQKSPSHVSFPRTKKSTRKLVVLQKFVSEPWPGIGVCGEA